MRGGGGGWHGRVGVTRSLNAYIWGITYWPEQKHACEVAFGKEDVKHHGVRVVVLWELTQPVTPASARPNASNEQTLSSKGATGQNHRVPYSQELE